jgi:predicted lipoprotein with Yx(FWY)xxD motif
LRRIRLLERLVKFENIGSALNVRWSLASGCLFLMALGSVTASAAETLVEQYVDVPMPEGFRVEASELEGPVIADVNGRTVYTWPSHGQRNGYSGETQGNPACYDEVLTVTAGLMSPYPPGIILPELDSRPSCTDLWPPVVATEGAEEVGEWTILERDDGLRQWSFEEHPLYTSVHDNAPGDVLGGTTRHYGGDSPANRVPLTPPSKVPPGFAVKTTTVGRLLTTDTTYSVYVYDRDTPEQSMCDENCAQTWKPILAPTMARAQDEWSIIERSPGLRQWVYRQRPLYTYVLDQHTWSLEGSDVQGWSNVYTQLSPAPPPEFTVQETLAGEVLADATGNTLYIYNCGDDSADQLACDHPNDTQVYRVAMCGGDVKKCLQYWPYVEAPADAAGDNRAWSVVSIDPKTGHYAESEQTDALRVWAYRDRPVYTYGGDERPGDVHGAGTGEWRAQRNGLKAIWLRDDYMRGTL